MIIIPELKEKCLEILKVRSLYIDDIYGIYESIFGIKLDTDLAINIHKSIIDSLDQENIKSQELNVDDVSNLEYWEKDALLKTLLADVNMEFKLADLIVSLYTDSHIYKGNVSQEKIDFYINKLNKRS